MMSGVTGVGITPGDSVAGISTLAGGPPGATALLRPGASLETPGTFVAGASVPEVTGRAGVLEIGAGAGVRAAGEAVGVIVSSSPAAAAMPLPGASLEAPWVLVVGAGVFDTGTDVTGTGAGVSAADGGTDGDDVASPGSPASTLSSALLRPLLVAVAAGVPARPVERSIVLERLPSLASGVLRAGALPLFPLAFGLLVLGAAAVIVAQSRSRSWSDRSTAARRRDRAADRPVMSTSSCGTLDVGVVCHLSE